MKILITLVTFIVLLVGGLAFTVNTNFQRSYLSTSHTTENLSNIRSVQIGLLSFYIANKKFPEKLEQLIGEEMLEQRHLMLVDRELYYISGLDADENTEKIILYSPPTNEDEKVIVGFVDGGVKRITSEELNIHHHL